MTRNVHVELLNLKTVVEDGLGFVVPCYQRPYVWSETDATQLFDDIRNAWLSDEPPYFIGSVLSTQRRTGDDNRLELIDGQQRVTTLMLLALALAPVRDGHDGLAKVPVLDNKPRLEFDIRPAVSNLLGSHAGLANYSRPGRDEIDRDEYLYHMNANLEVLQERVEKLEPLVNERHSTADFCAFVYTQVRWLNNQVPPQLDLNRLFYSINMGGIQLEPTDLLKSKLLLKITDEKLLYRKIWEACENTNNYFERNLRQIFGKSMHGLPYDALARYSAERFTSGLEPGYTANVSTLPEAGLTIGQIADLPTPRNPHQTAGETSAGADEEEPNDTLYCRSIVSFDLLLIHTLRIFSALYPGTGLEDVRPRIHAKHLLQIFEPLLDKDGNTIKQFLQVLWSVRHQFDRWVVKWLENEGGRGETLQLSSVSLSDGRLSRSRKGISNLVQLQAVRNFTGERSAQYWLTPFLAWLVETEETDENKITCKLEDIDNQLSLAILTQKEASFALACGREVEQRNWAQIVEYLHESRGTGFEHYWFQKLEYVLWLDMGGSESKEPRLLRYRITSKNSIEHVHPQNEEHGRTLGQGQLNDFGNLALLSPGENSSYSNKTMRKKKADFEDGGKRSYDSLKLKKIFDEFESLDRWKEQGIEAHRNEMIRLLSEHYSAAGQPGLSGRDDGKSAPGLASIIPEGSWTTP